MSSIGNSAQQIMLFNIATLLIGVVGAAATVIALFADELKKSPLLRGIVVIPIGLLTAIALFVGIQGVTASGSSITNTPRSTNPPIAISSRKDWQSTGVQLNPGDKVLIQITDGKWTIYRGPLSSDESNKLSDSIKNGEIFINYSLENNRVGNSVNSCWTNNCPVKDASPDALIAKIGLDGPTFTMGKTAKNFNADRSGLLYLRINDGSSLDDNFGILAVTVEVNP